MKRLFDGVGVRKAYEPERFLSMGRRTPFRGMEWRGRAIICGEAVYG